MRSLLPAALGAVARGLVGEQGWRIGLTLLEMAGFAGDYSQTGHANVAVFLDEAARARRDDPWEALISECGNPPVTEEERTAIVRYLEREGILDAGTDDERTT